MNIPEVPEFFNLISETEKMIKYRDEEIQTTWMISLSANRFYRKTDCLYATQDIKFDDELTPNEISELLFTKAAAYRKRVLKANGWIAKACGGLEKHYDLKGNMTVVNPNSKNNMGNSKYSNEIEWPAMVGELIEKISGKPFKSGMKTDYPIGIEINPNTNKSAFRMLDCNSLVDCHMCKLVNKI